MVVIKEITASSSRNYILIEIINIIVYKVLVDTSLKSFSYFITFFLSIPS